MSFLVEKKNKQKPKNKPTNFPLNNIKKTQMIALNTYEKGRKEDILVHKHLLLLFTKLAFPSYSLAELVRKSGFLAQVSGVGGGEKPEPG